MTNARDARPAIADFLEETFLFSFKDDDVSDDDNLFGAGYIDSYGLVQLVVFLEQTFSITVPQDMMFSPRLASLAGIVALVKERLPIER